MKSLSIERECAGYEKFLLDFSDSLNRYKFWNFQAQKKFNMETYAFLDILTEFGNIAPFRKRKLIQKFIHRFNKFLFASVLIRRFISKPLGYPGDFIMFEMVYASQKARSGIGLYFDNFVLNDFLTQAIISRKDKMKEILVEFMQDNLKEYKILNIGCGPAREIIELIKTGFVKPNSHIELCDQDRNCIVFLKNKFSNIKHYENLTLTHVDALGLFRLRNGPLIKRKYDLIYSMGVVDYFGNNILEVFIKKYFLLLKLKGKLIFAVCSARNKIIYTKMEWFYDWHIYIRDHLQLKKLIECFVPNHSGVRILWEKHRQIFFVEITK